MDEFGAPPEGAAPTGPLEVRISDKLWKWRKAAYEELVTKFKYEASDEDVRTFSPSFKAIAADANPAALEAGLDAISAFLNVAPPAACTEIAEPVTAGVIAKGLGGRPATKQRALDVIYAFVECCKEAGDTAIAALVENGVTHKTPKIAAASLESIATAAEMFGARELPVREILAAMPACFEHKDKGVREQAARVLVVFHGWLGGAALAKCMGALRAGQVKEIEQAIETAEASRGGPGILPTATRETRSARLSRATSSSSASDDSAAAAPSATSETIEPEEENDELEFVEAISVLSKLPNTWDKDVASAKWSERRDAVDALIAAADFPKIASEDFTEVVSVLKKLLGDANVVVVSRVALAVDKLANGAREDFSSYARSLLVPLIGKLKEKKIMVTDAVKAALVTFATKGALPLPDCIEDITATLEKKVVPKIRQEVCLWLQEVFNRSRQRNMLRQQVGSIVRPLAEFFCEVLNESEAAVRDAAASAFAALGGAVGEAPIGPFVDKLDPHKQKKVRDLFPENMSRGSLISAGTTKSARAAAPPEAKPASAKPKKVSTTANRPKQQSKLARAATAAQIPTASDGSTAATAPKSQVKRPALSRRNTVASARPSTKPSSKSTASTSAVGGTQDVASDCMPAEEAMALAREFIPADVLQGLDSKAWKQRLESTQRIRAVCGGGPAISAETGEPLAVDEFPSEVSADVLVQLLRTKPGFKESNFQVLCAIFEAVTALSLHRALGGVNRAMAAVVVAGCVDKMHDVKVKEAAASTLSALVGQFGIQFVASQVEKHSAKHRMPKVSGNCLDWLSDIIKEFGTSSVKDPVSLVRWCKVVLDNPNGAARTSAVGALATLRMFYGPGFKDFVDTGDIKPALMKQIDQAFEEVAQVEPPKPTRAVAGEPANATAEKPAELPRADISGKLSKLVKALGDANWKTRKSALEAVLQLLAENNNRILPNVDPLFAGLALRLVDSNKNLVTLALGVIGDVFMAIGPASESQKVSLKKVVPPALACFGDKNAAVKAAAATCMTCVVEQTGLAPLVAHVAPAFEKISSREDLLHWLEPHWQSLDVTRLEPGHNVKMQQHLAKEGCEQLVKPLVECMEDKSTTVRHLAEVALGKFVAVFGGLTSAHMSDAMKDMKPASRRVMEPLLDKLVAEAKKDAKSAHAAKPPAKTAPTNAAKVPTNARSDKLADEPTKVVPTSAKVVASVPSVPTHENHATKSSLRAGDRTARQAQDRSLLDRSAPSDGWDLSSAASCAIIVEQVQSVFGSGLAELLASACNLADHDDACVSAAERGIKRILDEVIRTGFVDEIQLSSDVLLKWIAAVVVRFSTAHFETVSHALNLLQAVVEVLATEKCRLTNDEARTCIPSLLRRTSITVAAEVAQAVSSICRIYPVSKVMLLCTGALDDFEIAPERVLTDIGPLAAVLVIRKIFLLNGMGVANAEHGVHSLVSLLSRLESQDRELTKIQEQMHHGACGALHAVWQIFGQNNTERDALFLSGGAMHALMPATQTAVKDWKGVSSDTDGVGDAETAQASCALSDAEVLAHSAVRSPPLNPNELSASERSAAIASLRRRIACPIPALQVLQSSHAPADTLRPVNDWARAFAQYMPVAVEGLAHAALKAEQQLLRAQPPSQQAVADAARPLRHILGSCNAILKRSELQTEFDIAGIQPLMAALFATAGDMKLTTAAQSIKTVFAKGEGEEAKRGAALTQAVGGYLKGCSVCFDALLAQHRPVAFVAMLAQFTSVIEESGLFQGSTNTLSPLVRLYCRLIARELRSLKSFIDDVDVPAVLNATHQFWRRFPPEVWQRQQADHQQGDTNGKPQPMQSDYPHRLIKTALNELIAALGPSKAADEEKRLPDGIVGDYFRLLLTAQQQKVQSSQPEDDSRKSSDLTADQEQELSKIASILGQTTGLQQLRTWQSLNPGIDVWSHPPLRDFSTQWREHVQRSLRALNAADKENSRDSGGGKIAAEDAVAAALVPDVPNSEHLTSNVNDTMARISSLRSRMATLGVDVATLQTKEPAASAKIPTTSTVTSESIQRYRERLTRIKETISANHA